VKKALKMEYLEQYPTTRNTRNLSGKRIVKKYNLYKNRVYPQLDVAHFSQVGHNSRSKFSVPHSAIDFLARLNTEFYISGSYIIVDFYAAWLTPTLLKFEKAIKPGCKAIYYQHL
jgi:hypothetical protein